MRHPKLLFFHIDVDGVEMTVAQPVAGPRRLNRIEASAEGFTPACLSLPLRHIENCCVSRWLHPPLCVCWLCVSPSFELWFYLGWVRPCRRPREEKKLGEEARQHDARGADKHEGFSQINTSMAFGFQNVEGVLSLSLSPFNPHPFTMPPSGSTSNTMWQSVRST